MSVPDLSRDRQRPSVCRIILLMRIIALEKPGETGASDAVWLWDRGPVLWLGLNSHSIWLVQHCSCVGAHAGTTARHPGQHRRWPGAALAAAVHPLPTIQALFAARPAYHYPGQYWLASAAR